MKPRARIEYRSRALRDAGLWRDWRDGLAEPATGTPALVDARSNDYLGAAATSVSRETGSRAALRMGAGSSRVVSGTWQQHLELEGSLASWLKTEACLLFSSGYAANLGVISALAGPGETVISDALNHASIIDGCRLSRATVVILPHAQPEALERALRDTAGVRWVVTESYFGMDGDSPNLRALRSLCDAHGAALIVDEAHALGVFGPEGRGLCAAADVVPDVLIGGLGKAFGCQGGFAACDSLYRDWLWNRARSFVFSTAPSPASCSAGLDALAHLRGGESQRVRLRTLERALESTLQSGGVPLPAQRHGPVFPIVFGSEEAVLHAAALLRLRGVRCQPIRPPTVPRGASRLRVILRADMTDAHVALLGASLVEVWREAGAGSYSSAAPPGTSTGDATAMEPAAPSSSGAHGFSSRGATDEDSRAGANDGAEGQKSAPGSRAASLRELADACSGDAPVSPIGARSPRLGGSGELDSDGSGEAVPLVGAADGGDRTAAVPGVAPAPRSADATAGGEARSALPLRGVVPAENGRPPEGLSRRKLDIAETPAHVSTRAPAPATDASRWVILGTGTGIGKTYVAQSLVALIGRRGVPVAGLKPIETGVQSEFLGRTDAAALGRASFHVKLPAAHPLYALPDPLAPSLAARRFGTAVRLQAIPEWVEGVVSLDGQRPALVIETAGGVFSPVDDNATNLDLALALGPAQWILVAPDRLGVLHDVLCCLQALSAVGRSPDWLVLSAPESPDQSTGTNAAELRRRHCPPIITLPRHDPAPLQELLDVLATRDR